MPQERYNTEWVTENQAGIVIKSFDEIEGAVRQLMDGSTLKRLRTNIAAHENRAVYEAVDILSTLMPSSEVQPPAEQELHS